MNTVQLQKSIWMQKREITEHFIYRNLAARIQGDKNKNILRELARQEKLHYEMWRKITQREVAPRRWVISAYGLLTRVLGLSFGLRLMEAGERKAQALYGELRHKFPEVVKIIEDEQQHEQQLLSLIDDNFLRYVSSVVLGLNDALVELTGALAGLTLALQNTRLIAVVGLITGIAASLSMGASEYLSTKEEDGARALQAGLVTGTTYLVTVALLISPYFVLASPFAALAATLAMAVVIIFFFTFYTAVARAVSFRRKF
ncbi:rubrerythrin family protein, partial [Candidatus Parcubacteria bacterium]